MNKELAIQKEVQKILGTDEVYLVGGSVRDLVMGMSPKDYDFTTSMTPDEMELKVKAAGRRAYTIGKQFGTIGFKVPIEDDNLDIVNLNGDVVGGVGIEKYYYVEVTTFRSEVYTSKSRKPEVKFVPSLDEDLARRDFTMNAMVLRSDGTIYDPYGGRLDIYAKQVKTVGLPKDRIIEDPLRMLRAARFAARFGFKIDPNFIGKARQLADRIFDVSVERWVQELDKLLVSEHSLTGLDALQDMGLMIRILPELPEDTFGTSITPKDVDQEWKYLLSGVKVPHNVKEPTRTRRFIVEGMCHRFKFSNERTDFILDKVKKKE